MRQLSNLHSYANLVDTLSSFCNSLFFPFVFEIETCYKRAISRKGKHDLNEIYKSSFSMLSLYIFECFRQNTNKNFMCYSANHIYPQNTIHFLRVFSKSRNNKCAWCKNMSKVKTLNITLQSIANISYKLSTLFRLPL